MTIITCFYTIFTIFKIYYIYFDHKAEVSKVSKVSEFLWNFLQQYMACCHKSSIYSKMKLHPYHKTFSFIRGAHLFVMTFVLVTVAHVDEKGCNSLLVTVL